jgi:class 3 adenylate cyclase/CheY-like chemotaxis protein
LHDPPQILVVDDLEDNREVLRARLASRGYQVSTAVNGAEALDKVIAAPPDLVLLDVTMPVLDGIATVRRLKADASLPFVPVILLTSRTDASDVVAGLDAGADDYLTKPIDHAALVARVRAMLRIKALQDEVAAQAAQLKEQTAQLAEWNKELETRVAAQLATLERMGRLKRFLPPQVADVILASPDGEASLESHRRDVAVLFSDLRGFTAFSEAAEPEDVIALLHDYHALVGEAVFRRGGTLERFAGDAIMVLFNDPIPDPEYCHSAAALAHEIIAGGETLLGRWRKRGANLGIGIGVAAGFATLGKIGFRERQDYAAIGTVTNLASRLSGRAEAGQILVSARLAEEIEPDFPSRFIGDLELRGFLRPVPVYELTPGDRPQAR